MLELKSPLFDGERHWECACVGMADQSAVLQTVSESSSSGFMENRFFKEEIL